MAQSSLKLRMLEVFRFRMFFFLSIVAVLFVFLIIQLIRMQLVQGNEYKRKSRMNMENNIPIPAPRGEIYDRNFRQGSDNVVIVSNRPSFNISTIPGEFSSREQFEKTIKRISRLLKISYDDVMLNVGQQSRWERVIIKEDVPFEVIVKIASYKDIFPNIDWTYEPVRVYNLANMFFHSIGYVGSISRDEYVKLRDKGYRHYQKIGKAGIESEYDMSLRGVDGYLRRIVDVRNRLEGEEIGSNPIAGNNIVLTIDSEIQSTAFKAMEGQNGAVVVIKPSTGEILALISKPDIDPNQIISRNNEKVITELYNDKGKPFLNRALQSRYPPASMFKLITAISALEEEKWQPNTSIYCPGKYTLKGYVDRDYYCLHVHGLVRNIEQAIAESCNVYFYQVGYKTGPTIILKYASYMGLGDKTSIDIPGEIPGFIPSKQWKQSTFGQQWYDGDTINLSIGQGFISTTTIGIANFISTIVNNGVVYKCHVVKEIRSPDNSQVIKRFSPEKVREIPLSELTLNSVKTGMRLAVTGEHGTAAWLRDLKVPVAGKTGTAQTRSIRKEKESQHAWFVSYAPYSGDVDKTVAVIVMVEYGVWGASAAVPVAKQIYSKLISLGYF